MEEVDVALVEVPALFAPARIRLLHYAHDAKPWWDEPSHPWMQPFWTLWDRFGGPSP